MNRETKSSTLNGYYIFVVAVIFVVAGLTLILMYMQTSLISEIEKDQNKYKAEIGKKLILEKDTLTIINYSSVLENFTLSNGTIVNASLVFSKGGVSVE